MTQHQSQIVETDNERMHGNPVKRNGGRVSATRQFAALQAVVLGNPEKISSDTWQGSATALPPFVFQKGNLRASQETRREDFFVSTSYCSGNN